MNKVKVGIAGLGRLGAVHAENIAFKIPGAQLMAACSVVDAELDYARNELGAQEVYRDFKQMLEHADIDAVAIVTPNTEHCRQITDAMLAGKHVFSDKPLGVSIEECRQVKKTIAECPEKVFFLGFMRRYDSSYAYAKQKIEEGKIGVPYLVKATSLDPEAVVEGCIRYSASSGGIFIDSGSHDIDLMRWFLGSDVTEVFAAGTTVKHMEFQDVGDCETGGVIYRFANGSLGMGHSGRIAPHGYHIETEIIGTEGHLRIGSIPEKNKAMLYNKDGAVVECVENFPQRFEEAYLLEMQEFISCIQEGRKPGVTAEDGVKAIETAYAVTQSFREGRPVTLSDHEDPI